MNNIIGDILDKFSFRFLYSSVEQINNELFNKSTGFLSFDAFWGLFYLNKDEPRRLYLKTTRQSLPRKHKVILWLCQYFTYQSNKIQSGLKNKKIEMND